MRPGAFHLSLAAAIALLAASLTLEATAAPLSGGAGPARFGSSFRTNRPTYRAGIRKGRPFGYGAAGFRSGTGRYGQGNRFGRGYGNGYGYGYGGGYGFGFGGLPIGYGFGPWDDAFGGYDGEPAPASKPEWPSRIGIPASPVLPPAIYVIGGSPRNAAAPVRRGSRAAATTRSLDQVASAPRFITVPSGR